MVAIAADRYKVRVTMVAPPLIQGAWQILKKEKNCETYQRGRVSGFLHLKTPGSMSLLT